MDCLRNQKGLPWRNDTALKVAEHKVQEGQPPRHVASIFLQKNDDRALLSLRLRPAFGIKVPGVQLCAIRCPELQVLEATQPYGKLGPSQSDVSVKTALE